MPKVLAAVLLLAALAVTSCAAPAAGPGVPPRAEARPHELETHGDVRVDEYYWLRERENPEVIAYLEAENAYVDAALAHTEGLQESVFAEIRSRVVEDDASVPYRDGDYWYYTRYEEGKQYAIHGRRPADGDVFGGDQDPEAEEVLIDVNEVAEGKEYTAVRPAVSPDHRILAYGVDDVGRRFYTVRFRDLTTGETLADEIPDVTANLVWAADSATLFYVRQDPATLRAYQVYRHRLGSTEADELVYEEPDETFSVFLGRTQSRKYLLATSSHTLRTEVRILRADDPDGDFAVFEPRGERHEYSVDHLGDRFWVRTNDGAPNFRLMSTAEGDTGRAAWREELPNRDDVLFEGFELFDRFLVLAERREGLERLRVEPMGGAAVEGHDLDFGEPTYSTGLGANPDPSSGTLRYVYQSLTTPRSVFDYDPATREKTLRKQDQVLGGFDAANYRSERLWATAEDGTQVPVSLVYRPDLRSGEGGSPLLLYGYGSYGSSMDASFSSPLLSLIDRGFVYAIAHIRGGEEMGRSWYENGKLLHKKNTFTDFIAAAEHLVAEGYADPDRIYAMGGSAGGLLVGAVFTMRPDLWDGVVARVPFVDVVTTMLDASIPLTTFEWDEWGDPRVREYYDYMLSYSPYDNVEARDYPHLLVTTGLHDSQVQYWEPAKWVARLRASKTDDNLLLLETNMGAGHGGASGRYDRYRETALVYAFLLDLAGLGDS
ncbi:MAG: S9 family peptidase [Holophagales bacterium]|nr:S9 family peptidase [Holophagales bacterium]MYD24019.1 S9 family peptidase [Holophagales bacterium]MYI32942.1 S9 family peptidase [Holophagales bacterium]